MTNNSDQQPNQHSNASNVIFYIVIQERQTPTEGFLNVLHTQKIVCWYKGNLQNNTITSRDPHGPQLS